MPGFELFGDAERKEVNDVLNTGILMRYGFDPLRDGHWKASELEAAMKEAFATEYAQLTSSGTAALTVALACLGVGAGDEVIVPTFTFVASFEAVLSVGAVPVLVDVDDTLTLDPEAVRRAVTPRTRVVMPVHMCGSMADLDALREVCDENGLFLLEDACQAIGGSYKGTKLGAYGDIGCFSFDFVKTITCGEGGGLITDNADFARKADHYHDHGHDHLGANRGLDQHPFLGYNYRISELNAAVGLAQIRKLDQIVELQRRNKKIIEEALAGVAGLTFRRLPDPAGDNASFTNFFLPTEAQARAVNRGLAEAGVDACFYWYDNYWHYIREWDHLKQLKVLTPLSAEVRQRWAQLANRQYQASDAIMSRAISSLIKVGWTEEEVRQRAAKMARAVDASLRGKPVA